MSQDQRIGTELAGYRIDSFLGRGGMGVVYVAEHLRLRRRVALKVLANDLAQDGNFQERFVRESQLAASLDHPNIVPVYDAGEVDGLLYLSMRLVEGSDLKEIIEQEGPLDPQRVLRIMEQVGSALDTAHDSGLVHRDVKPQNMLVNKDSRGRERVFLSDFGLTKHTGSHSGLTATGTFIGTIDYVAPEQIEGKDVDGRTDIYALGCVLHECLSGTVPHQKDSEVAVIYAHLSEVPPPVSSKRPGMSPAVDAVVARAMARDKEDRFSSCEEMVDALRAALEGRPVGGTVVAPAPRPPQATVASTVADAGLAPDQLPAPDGQSTGTIDKGGGTAPEPVPTTVEPAPSTPTSKLPWILLGLLLLVALGGGGFLLLSSNEETPAPIDNVVNNKDDDGAGKTEPQPPSGPIEAATITASSTSADGVDAGGNPVSYGATNAIDGDPTTTWRTNGDGTGQTLTLEFGEPIHVTKVGLIPGYAKIDPVDNTNRFLEERRVLGVEYLFDDGTVIPQSFREVPRLQFTNVDDVVTESVTIRITSTSAPGARDFTPVSEVEVQGFQD
jgi:serine/threonine protein kinase